MPPVGGTGFTILTSRTDGPARTLRLPRHRHLRRLPRRAGRPRRTGATGTRSSPAPTAARASRSSPALPYDRAAHHHGRLPDVRRLRPRVRRPGRPPLPRPADRLPRLRAAAAAGPRPAAAAHGPVDGRTPVAEARALLAAGRDPRRQGPGRLPPGLRRRRTRRRSHCCARRKERGDKPFAVMAADRGRRPPTSSRLSPEERSAARPARRRPVVLLRRRARRTRRRPRPAEAVAPGSPDLGVHAAVHARCTTCCSGCPATRPARGCW